MMDPKYSNKYTHLALFVQPGPGYLSFKTKDMIVANISLISNSLVELKPFNAKLEWCDAFDTSVFDILLPFSISHFILNFMGLAGLGCLQNVLANLGRVNKGNSKHKI